MSQVTSFTNKFRVHKTTSTEASNSGVLKRARESLVCTQCRKSKTRCDRRRPCGSCTRRNDPDGCDYRHSSVSNVDVGQFGPIGHKLAHLESMVKQLMHNQISTQSDNRQASQRPEPEQVSKRTRSKAVGSVQEDQSEKGNYVGSTHWSTILDELQDLKSLISVSQDVHDTEDELSVQMVESGHDPIFGAFSNFSIFEVISEYLPAKVDIDRLISLYFQGPIFIIPFLHTHQFQRQYRAFWANTTEVNPLWLSILFSICYMSAWIRDITGPAGPPLKDSYTGYAFLHVAAGQCLVLGEYNRPQRFAVEALAMYAQSKHFQTLDPSREAGAILSMAVRIAYQLGYHRDPEATSLSVFEGEMRRRCWAICKQMDLMTSFELGLPSNICIENCDTKSPRNLWDTDFDEDTLELPPSRPEHEATRQLWFICKDRMMNSFSKVCRDALSFHVKSESEVMQLDREIRQMYETLPDVLRVQPVSESITQSPFIIFSRVYVESIYLKCLCVLHRRYMARGNAFSTTSCVESAMKLVGQFIDISKEFAPGGQLYMERWMLTNYTVNDYLLGVMVLCFVLHTSRSSLEQHIHIDTSTELEINALLKSSQAVLTDKSEKSKDARRVSHIVRLIVDGTKTSSTSPSNAQSPPGIAQNIEVAQPPIVGSREQESVMGPFEPFTFMNNPIGDFDWNLFDLDIPDQDTYQTED